MQGKLQSLQKACDGDMEFLDERINSLVSHVGSCNQEDLKADCITVWDAISFIYGSLDSLKIFTNSLESNSNVKFGSAMDKVNAGQLALQDIASSTSKGFNELLEVIKTLNNEQSILSQRFMTSQAAPSSTDPTLQRLVADVQDMATRLSAMEQRSAPSLVPAVSFDTQDEIGALKSQLKMLEARVPLHNVLRLGGRIFQSRSEVALFIEKNMPSNSFSMFHDIVTLMERLSGTYVERKDVISEWYQASKVGLDEREARHIASFKITYPTVFGYVKDGAATTKYHLPAIKSFKEWNSFDSESGIKSFILNGMEDLKLQLYQDIASFFDIESYHHARVLAHDMHTKSQIFVAEMCNWMDVFYQELLTTSEASEDEAWDLVSACIKKVFEELRRVRASAANATTETNPTARCATYLWALIQSHRVMKEFIDMRFRNHSSIAPVITLHIFKTRVTRVAHNNNIKRLEGRLAKLESAPALRNTKLNPKDGEKNLKGGGGKDPDAEKKNKN